MSDSVKPVAWRWRYKGTNWVYGNDMPIWASADVDDCDEEVQPLYAAPPPAEAPPLTVEEVARVIRDNMPGAPHDLASVNQTAQAIVVRMAEKGVSA